MKEIAILVFFPSLIFFFGLFFLICNSTKNNFRDHSVFGR
jgi:hypothetical protein